MIRQSQTAELDVDELREAIRDVLDREAGSERTRHAMNQPTGHNAKLWEIISELGWTGIAIPEEHGGAGASLVELGVVMQELGRSLAPCAFVPSVVLFGGALQMAGSLDQLSKMLPRIASGDLLASVALVGSAGRCEGESLGVEIREQGTEISLRGVAAYVPDADVAELILVAGRAPDGDTALVIVETGLESVEITPQPLFDPTRSFSRLELHDVVVPREAMLGDPAGGAALRERLIDLGIIALACDSAGGAGQVLESTLAYTKERQQFDRPVASFQALKHRCADMMMRVEGSAVSVARALEAFAGEQDEARITASEAKFFAADGYIHVAQEGVQMHGGVGFTWEYDCHFYLKRALLNQALLGDSRWHRDRAADALFGAPAHG
jgi:alkylation response protein AidB-like acyl-CoA dehydrogenase